MPAGWVSAGIAAVGVGESIMSNNDAKSAAAKNNATAANLGGAQEQMLNTAEQVSNQPFQAYQGTLTAPLSGNQQQGMTLASQSAANGAGQADVASGTGLLASEQPWNSTTASQYENPYTQQVTDAALAQQNKSYLQSMAQQQTGAGATNSFGNARNAIEESNLTAANTLNSASLTATNNAAAYDSAMKAWQSDNQAKTAAANAYFNAGSDVTNMTDNQITQLMQTGGVAQLTAQTNLSNEYAQFMRQQGWSAQQLQSLINGVSSAKGSPAQTPPIQSNVANSLLGLGAMTAGMYGGSKTSTPSGSGTPSAAYQNYGGAQSSSVQAPGYDSSGMQLGFGSSSGFDSTAMDGIESDRRAKRDVRRVGKDSNGLPIYTFRYKALWLRFRGYMAQDVEKLFPQAVITGKNGMLRILYERIPNAIKFRHVRVAMGPFTRDGVF